jgi:acetylornithine deacetylase/succinyl-diaminopimelate desuccinylase-like protein
MSREIQQKIRARCADPTFQDELTALLIDMCAVDTTPNPEVSVMREREKQVFDQIRGYLESPRCRSEHRPIPPEIAQHPAFSLLHFTKTPENPEGLSPDEAYRGRSNLLAFMDGAGGRGVAVNAHIDVIAPFFPPRREGDSLYGRGVIDDKGNVAAICAALRIIDGLVADGSLVLKGSVTAMFPIEEETGGNGSLALALDAELKQHYDALLVMECADMGVYPANRGAVWFRSEARRVDDSADLSLVEAVAWGVLAMQQQGAKIKAQSDHPLFPHRPVQTCNGILGPFGEHPSRINGRVEMVVHGADAQKTLDRVQAAAEEGVRRYVEHHGDKTQVLHPETGKPKVARHFELAPAGGHGISLIVHGSSGHMGSILEHDDAILKWAYIVRELVHRKRAENLPITLELAGADASQRLVLEGGQGFLPTHPIEAVQQRMADAFATGIRDYLESIGLAAAAVEVRTTYEKLHNAAYAGDPDSPSVQHAIWAARQANTIDPDAPLRGWDVSCDARLFASQYPDMPVITSGVGVLACAHSNDEMLYLPELWKTIEFCVLFLLRETGSIGDR